MRRLLHVTVGGRKSQRGKKTQRYSLQSVKRERGKAEGARRRSTEKQSKAFLRGKKKGNKGICCRLCRTTTGNNEKKIGGKKG